MELRCPSCGRTYEPADAWRCACGSPLQFADAMAPSGPDLPVGIDGDRSRGVWAFADLLPPVDPVTLGEGWTPLCPAPHLAALEDGSALKLEFVSPTGSFKDRGAAVTVALADSLDVDRVLEDSSGNAGLAIATYAARADIDAQIFVPADASTATLAAIERTGATLRPIDGDREAVTAACVAAVDAGDGWYASHAWQPAFIAGTATIAYEIAGQRNWRAPDAVVVPVGHGTLLLGAARGFGVLRQAGVIDTVPRLLAVQAAGVAPIVARRGRPTAGENSLAKGIQVAEPARDGEIETAISETDGDAIAVGRDATADASDRLTSAGYPVAPTSAVALAGLEAFLEDGTVESSEDVVVPLTGRSVA